MNLDIHIKCNDCAKSLILDKSTVTIGASGGVFLNCQCKSKPKLDGGSLVSLTTTCPKCKNNNRRITIIWNNDKPTALMVCERCRESYEAQLF